MTALEEKSLLELPWTGLDFEGAGSYNGQEDAPVQAGFAHMSNGCLGQTYREYLYVNRKISPFATSIHRITNEMIQGKPTLVEVWPMFKPWWGKTIVVAHNIATEKKFTRIFNMSGRPIWVDTLKIARAQYPKASKHSLSDMLGLVGGMEEVHQLCQYEAHDALFDAIGAVVLLKKLLNAEGWGNLNQQQASSLSLDAYHKAKNAKRNSLRY